MPPAQHRRPAILIGGWLTILCVALVSAAVGLPYISRAALQSTSFPQADQKTKRPQSVPGEILVRFKKDAAVTKTARAELTVSESGRQIQVHVERIDGPEIVEGLRLGRVAAEDTASAIRALRASPDVLYAEPNFLRYKDAVPNDPRYAEQWALKNAGQSGGIAGADIRAEQAWDITTGNRNFVVAVIDEGIDINHQDLQQNIWRNPGEIPGNGVDDDGDGYIDDVNGFDFYHNNGSVYDGPGTNPDGSIIDAHGTHVAGIIGATGNNGVGISGVDWQVSLMSLKFLGPDGGTSANAIRAYSYAKMMRDRWVSSGGAQGANVRVTNNSYGGSNYSQAEVDAIQAMGDSGILFVAAAGNFGQDSNAVPSYPASYDLPCVISVAATDRSDNLAYFSNRGSRSVQLGAPGDSILSTTPGNTYSVFSGTSMAAPHVAGVAALVLAAHPDFTVDRLRAAILFGGDPIASLAQTTVTGNRLNATGTLQNASQIDATPPAAIGDLHITAQTDRSVGLSWTAPGDDGASGRAALYLIRFADQVTGAKFLIATQRPNPAGSQEFAEVAIPYRHTAGTITLLAYDKAGNSSTASLNVLISTPAADPYIINEGAAEPLSTGGGPLNANADDALISYGLPFNFPMFERYTSSILLSTNGAIYFAPNTPRDIGIDLPSARSRLAGFQMIAGLWDDLDLRKSVRADADIYYLQPDADRVIFRWQGVPCNLSQTTGQCTGGDAVNFEIELRRDGTIITRYGAGNTHLHPVVGIGAAEPDAYAIASHTSEVTTLDLTNAPTVTFTLRTPPKMADLKISTRGYPTTVVPGNNITFTTTVTNAGPDSASGVRLADTIPAASLFVSCSTSQGGCYTAANSRVVTATLGTITSGASATVTVVVNAPVVQISYSNTAVVSARTYDTDLSSNTWSTSSGVYQPNPNPITGIVSLGSGGRFALTADGSLLAWGSNTNGQLGDGTTIDRSTPVWVRGLYNVKFAAAGAAHSIAIKQSGTLWTWGSNNSGTLGDGTTTDRLTPVQVPGLTGMKTAAGGGGHTIAVKSDGTVWTWGTNNSGQLGDNTPTFRVSPAQVAGLNGVVAVSAGVGFSMALRNDGTVWTWGDNIAGQLGDGTTTDRRSPAQVPGLTGIIRIAAGAYHSVALKNDGTVWSWGQNTFGQLGDGSTSLRTAPIKANGLGGVSAIAAGAFYTLALGNDGTIYAWGNDQNGALGVGLDLAPLNYLTTPMPVIILTNATAIAAGSVSLGLSVDGSVYSWGGFVHNYPYQVTAAVPRPILETPTFSPDGGVYSVAQMVSISLTSSPGTVRSVGLGGSHSLAVMSDGKVYAWGINDGGQIGLPGPFGPASYSPIPVLVNGIDSAKAVAGADGHSLALRTDGTVWAWGRNDFGQSGTGGSTSNVPAPVLNLSNITAISASGAHSLALRADGTVWLWGNGGDGTSTTQVTPIQVAGLSDVKAVATGSGHGVVVKNDGTVWTWGRNNTGQLGDGTQTSRQNPAQVMGLANIVAVAAGYAHTVALRNDGTVWAWGDNQYGEIGDGTQTNRSLPTQALGLTSASAVAAGGQATLALRNDGSAWAWGYTDLGAGIGPLFSLAPAQVAGLANLAGISVGSGHFAAFRQTGMMWLWGNNMWGQVGDSTIFERRAPALITALSNGPVIHYTTNGLEPTDDDPVIGSGSTLSLDQNTTLKARVFQDGFAPSAIKSASYIINLNPIDDTRTFVRQHYLDFLSREPDQGGWDYWTSQITQCGLDPVCLHNQRIAVSAAFFIELEFQQTGSVVYRLYRAAYGRLPNSATRANISYAQFTADRGQLVGGSGLPQSTIDFANNFVQRTAFKTLYSETMTSTEFVNTLFDTANLNPTANAALRQAEIDAMNNNGKTRAQVMLDVIEINEFKTREYNPSFVLMQYFGYLRRDPDQGGYDFWLDILNNGLPNDSSGYRAMVCAFITSTEYQLRFGTSITRSNKDCG